MTPIFLVGKVFSNFKLFLGFTLFGLSSVVWLVVLSRVELSFAYPMVSMGYILTLLISWKFLGECISPMRWIAVCVICAGVAMLAKS
jgi:drug/metabolite transporter (DMT)-like permease